eukprot:6201097-Pleurochrysis_carterae.AAC.3
MACLVLAARATALPRSALLSAAHGVGTRAALPLRALAPLRAFPPQICRLSTVAMAAETTATPSALVRVCFRAVFSALALKCPNSVTDMHPVGSDEPA